MQTRYHFDMMSPREYDECTREVAFLERILTANPSDTANWVLRSEIYNHLATKRPDVSYTTEQLFFGAYVAGFSAQRTRRAALTFSFLSNKTTNFQQLAKDNENDADI